MTTEIMRLAAKNFNGGQAALAKEMGISAQYLSDLLNDRRPLSPKIIKNYCDAMGIERNSKHERAVHRMAAREQGWLV